MEILQAIAWLFAPGGIAVLILGWIFRRRIVEKISTTWIGRRINAEKDLIAVKEELNSTRASWERRAEVWKIERAEILDRLDRREVAWSKERAEMTSQIEWLIASLNRLTALAGGYLRAQEQSSPPGSERPSLPPTLSAENSLQSSKTSETTKTS